MQEVHIGSKGTEITFRPGYLNRAMRRKIMKSRGMFKKERRLVK